MAKKNPEFFPPKKKFSAEHLLLAHFWLFPPSWTSWTTVAPPIIIFFWSSIGTSIWCLKKNPDFHAIIIMTACPLLFTPLCPELSPFPQQSTLPEECSHETFPQLSLFWRHYFKKHLASAAPRQFKVAKKVLIVGPKQLFVHAIYRQLVYFFRQIARFRRVSKQSKTGRYW
jgi:hypothetical protein